jgi:phosphoenolpyruvate carboxykinase (ATP)
MIRQKFLDFANKIPENQINPSRQILEDLSQHQMIPNNTNNPLFHSGISERSSGFSQIYKEGDEENLAFILKAFEMVNPEDYILMRLQIGQSDEIKLNASFAVNKNNANIALMLQHNFFERSDKNDDVDIITLYVPDFPERRVIIDPTNRMTFVLGIDYYGEGKMSILRMAMEIMRRDKAGLGVHAGSKIVRLKQNDEVKEYGLLVFGLSGTGKTTLICHDHGLVNGESVLILQDDINLITSDGRSFGTEKGFYVKCDSFPEHKLLTKATLQPGNILENVYVDSEGNIDWKNFSVSANTRAVIHRNTVDGTADTIDLPSLDVILYNTRRPDLPPIGRLVSAAQSAAYYGLGESIITSAESAIHAGQSKRVVGFDPFVIGEHGLNINRVKKLSEINKNLQVFVVNTGYVGDESNDIGVEDTSNFIIAALRGQIEWEFDEDLGYELPKTINGEKVDKFDPRVYYGSEDFKQRMVKLREERKEHMRKFLTVDEDIIDSL